ncbi:kinase-like protein [Hesseltinella vesiculosa]|uniref:non-specific serine/threonine protein kinase n=1 Tax=Hesseltinella vesiculosa TaxID=101127 RepID=A0A1X2G873_9FUNG|nr:kinase-like protein [Hesseltinella vesiculosa]
MDSDSDRSDSHSVYTDDEEDIYDYKPGGYHPVHIGDVLHDNRYKILLKLGWGHFSTVWLAYDAKTEAHVAVKIVKSSRRFSQGAQEEISLLDKICQSNPDAPGYQHVAQLLDHFEHEGVNGTHVCMVFEALGESLLSLIKRFDYKGVPAPIVKKIASQILLGLDYLHRECGIIHTDIKPENVLVYVPNMDTILQDQFGIVHGQRINDEPQPEPTTDTPPPCPSEPSSEPTQPLTKAQKKRMKKKLKKLRQKEKDILERNGIRKNRHDLIISSVLDFTDGHNDTQAFENIVVKIADLGNACWIQDENSHLIQTREYRSPEVIIGGVWNEKTDLWSLACMVFELLTGDFLFDPRATQKYTKDDDHIAQMLELMGEKLPNRLTQKCVFSEEFFDDKGRLKHIKNLRFKNLHDVLQDTYQQDDDISLLAEFMSPMLVLDDQCRTTAAAIMNHPWLH